MVVAARGSDFAERSAIEGHKFTEKSLAQAISGTKEVLPGFFGPQKKTQKKQNPPKPVSSPAA
jgi:hypothetical protein